MNQLPSPSRTYVVVCNKSDFSGFFMRKFTLPETEENSRTHAMWYFLNVLNFVACIESICFTNEEFTSEVKDQDAVNREADRKFAALFVKDLANENLGKDERMVQW